MRWDRVSRSGPWGRLPSRRQLVWASRRNVELIDAAERSLRACSVPLADAARRAGVAESKLLDARVDGDLLTFDAEGLVMVPVWQLEPRSPTGVLPGLAALKLAFNGSLAALSRWAQRPCPDLDDRTPAAALRVGEVEDVLIVAQSLGAW